MTGFLAPRSCNQHGVLICVGFAGLDDERYDKLEIALNDDPYQLIGRNTKNPWYSAAVVYPDLEPGVFYRVRGRITQDDEVKELSVVLCAVDNDAPKVKPISPGSGGQSVSSGGITVG